MTPFKKRVNCLLRQPKVDSQGLKGAPPQRPLFLLSRRHGLRRRPKVDSQGLEGANQRRPLLCPLPPTPLTNSRRCEATQGPKQPVDPDAMDCFVDRWSTRKDWRALLRKGRCSSSPDATDCFVNQRLTRKD